MVGSSSWDQLGAGNCPREAKKRTKLPLVSACEGCVLVVNSFYFTLTNAWVFFKNLEGGRGLVDEILEELNAQQHVNKRHVK